MKQTWLWWSSGKDSAWTLHVLRQQQEFEVSSLVTTVNEAFERVAMHAVRVELLQRQAEAIGLPLQIVRIPHPCSNSEYEQAVASLLDAATQEDVRYMAFGDLFLQDVRQYREHMLNGSGIRPIFPLWDMNTSQLSRTMVREGLRAYTTCIDPRCLSKDFIGCEYDSSFLDKLPERVDPCGENGEFHTFAFAGPMFSRSIRVTPGEVAEREGFVFSDLQIAGT
ncbi:MAG: ATP-binding protein [Chthoniobacterales bacterium]